MSKIIFIVLGVFFVYELTAHIIHKIWNISSSEAKEKINQKIVWFFSSEEPVEYKADVFLSEPEAKELGEIFKRYFHNISPSFYQEHADKGIIAIGYRTAGIVAKYEKERNILAQSITFDIADYYMCHRGFEPCISIRELTENTLVFFVAYNQKGINYLKQRAEQIRAHQLAKIQCPKALSGTLKVNAPMNQNNTLVHIGCYLADWQQRSQPYTITIDLQTHPHVLLTGASGSGKSYCLNILLYYLSRTKYKIWLGDYKASKDFAHFKGYKNYATGNDVETLIDEYYELFEGVRNGEVSLCTPQVLVLDEYPSFIQSISIYNKKRADEIKAKISTLLMMGRCLDNDGSRTQFCVWITAQRADASIFSAGGARDNFMVWIALGNQSAESKRMITDSPLPDTQYRRGEGIVKIDGEEIVEIIIPEIRNFKDMTAATSSCLS